MRATVDIGTATTVKVVLSKADLDELVALYQLVGVQARKGGVTYDMAELIKITPDLYLNVAVESDLVHYAERIKG